MESIKELIKNIATFAVKQDIRIISISLLGSYYNGSYRDNSDIDLAIVVDPDSNFSTIDKINLETELTLELNKQVDIGLISSKNLVYAREALLNGELLFTRDIDRFNLTKATLLGMYIDFNHNRQELINEYRA